MIFDDKIRNICKKCNFFVASVRKFLKEYNLERRGIAKKLNTELHRVLM